MVRIRQRKLPEFRRSFGRVGLTFHGRISVKACKDTISQARP